MTGGMLFRDLGSTGLRQYGGWVREEFLHALQGRQAQRVYREMGDNSPVVGSILFAVIQVMRKVDWRDIAADDTPAGRQGAQFAWTLRDDMSSSWEDHIVEALSMLQFGFAPCEIVYKRRLGLRGARYRSDDASSRYNDGLIGIRRLPLRGQETIYKWFFDQNGQITGLSQQPWSGPMIDIPMGKLLLYRPSAHKNNPEGRSILRPAYRPWYFMKRVEELEAILFERMGGLPVVRVPNALLLQADAGVPEATAALNMYKRLAANIRVDEQMGVVMPSDVYKDNEGRPSGQRMYDFELKTPDTSALRVDPDAVIRRYGVDILKSILADFIDLGHQARGTQSLSISKIDLFYTSIRGWLQAVASVINRHLYPRVWALNALSMDTLPRTIPDLPMRVDLDVLGGFVSSLARSGMPLFPDPDLENYIRAAAGMPQLNEGETYDPTNTLTEETENLLKRSGEQPGSLEDTATHLLGMAALTRRRQVKRVARPPVITTGK